MYCQCGCGQKTSISKRTDPSRGNKRGQPVRFMPGHNASRMQNIQGQRFGRLIAQERVTLPFHGWRCICDCGNISVVRHSDLKNGKVVSCGCWWREQVSEGKMFTFKAGEDNPNWKGDEVGYSGVHRYLLRNFKKTGKCIHCKAGVGTAKGGTEWANISGEYKRDINDYLELCRTCHRLFDSLPKITPKLNIFSASI